MNAICYWITRCPKIIVWYGDGQGVKRATLAATACGTNPIFLCAVDLDGLLRLVMFQGGVLFSVTSTVFYNYNLTGSLLQQVSGNIYANQLLAQFVLEKHLLTGDNDIGTNRLHYPYHGEPYIFISYHI